MSLLSKILALIAFIIVVTVTSISTVSVIREIDTLRVERINKSKSIAQFTALVVKSSYETMNWFQTTEILDSINQPELMWITVIQPGEAYYLGKVSDKLFKGQNLIDFEDSDLVIVDEMVQEMETHEGANWPSEHLLSYVKKIIIGDEEWLVSVGVSFRSIENKKTEILLNNAIIGMVVLVVAWLIGFLIIRNLVRPLTLLAKGTNELAKGKFTQIPITNYDEIGNLTKNFNNMSLTLQTSQADLMSERYELELSREQLRWESDFNHNILNSINDALFVISPGMNIDLVNPAACKMMGFSSQELMNQSLGKIFTEGESFKNRKEMNDIPFLQYIESAIIDHANIAFLFGDKDGKLIQFNKKALSRLSMKNEKILNFNVLKHPDSEFADACKKVLSEGEHVDFEKTDFVSSNGDQFHIICRMYPYLEEGEILGIVILYYDTEKMLNVDLDFWMKQLESYQYNEVFKSDPDFIDREFSLTDNQNNQIPVLVSSTVMKDNDEDVMAVVLVLKDMRDLHNMQNQLVHAAKLTSLGEMSAGMAHELNNPLQIIQMSNSEIEYMVEDQDYEEIPVYLKRIERNVLRCTRIIEHLRSFSRADEMKIKPINLQHILDETLVFQKQRLDKIKIEFKNHIPENLPKILADPHQMEQILINLFQNAIDAIEADIGENSEFDRKPKIILKATAILNKSQVLIEFIDNGPGMNDAVKNHIFDPFFTTKRESKGTGLGLSILYGIIQSHKGRVKCESKIGTGTTFFIELPTE